MTQRLPRMRSLTVMSDSRSPIEDTTDFVSGMRECLISRARADWEVTPRPGRCLRTPSLNGREKNEDHVSVSDEEEGMAE